MPPTTLDLELSPLSSITRRIALLVMHCTATASGQWLGGRAPGVAGHRIAPAVIDGWHQERGFKRAPAWVARFNPTLRAIGYHYVVDLDGRLWTGRHLCERGAHAADFNAPSVGIALVGGAEREGRYTAAQWKTAAQLVRRLTDHLQVPLALATPLEWKGVCGHRDLSPDANGDGRVNAADWLKTCPGFDVAEWLGAWLQPLPRHVIPAGAP